MTSDWRRRLRDRLLSLPIHPKGYGDTSSRLNSRRRGDADFAYSSGLFAGLSNRLASAGIEQCNRPIQAAGVDDL
jgi:hypothetical protein